MNEIEKKAREIAESVIASRITPLIGKDYKGKIPMLKARIASVRAGTGDNLLEVEAARLGIIVGLEMAAKWHDDQSKIHHNDADDLRF